MGEVYRAKDLNLGRPVAIKVLPPAYSANPVALDRFKREAQSVATLNHPNILTIHDFGDEAGTLFAVTELLEGETLFSRIVSHEALGWKNALEIFIDVAEGLAAAHAKGIVHRDIKPDNIFLTDEGITKILDFGLARLDRPEPLKTARPGETLPLQTTPGTVIGTVGYMSPEQARGKTVGAPGDIFSAGCVLYEMLAGVRPFLRESPPEVMAAIINEEAPELKAPSGELPGELISIVNRCLNKTPEYRFADGGELLHALENFRDSQLAHSHEPDIKTLLRFGLHPLVMGPALAIAALGVWFGYKGIRQAQDKSWARGDAVVAINALTEEDRFTEAYVLARKAQEIVPDDKALQQLIEKMTETITIETNPPGAEVFFREYDKPETQWAPLGESPLEDVKIPHGFYLWELRKEGYENQLVALPSAPYGGPAANKDENPYAFELLEAGTLREGMVHIPTGPSLIPLTGLDAGLTQMSLPDFSIDRDEVTNGEYKEFVEAGGYENKNFWDHRFEHDGIELGFDEAMALFVDGTGRPGPATWELGSFTAGRENHPVRGVSWYEAEAYAKFEDKQLPTVYHWGKALSPIEISNPVVPLMVPLSNFGGKGPERVGTYAGYSAFGLRDMAGNVREWCFNQGGEGRAIVGGSWIDPAYMTTLPNSGSPFDRTETNGFRCAIYETEGPMARRLRGPVKTTNINFREITPFSDEVFEVLKRTHDYARTALNAAVDKPAEDFPNWTREVISLDVSYTENRLNLFIFLPKNAKPPYQTVVYCPGADVGIIPSSDLLDSDNTSFKAVNYIPQDGRALVYPVYSHTFERRDRTSPGFGIDNKELREEIGRTMDYLETRTDIDSDHVGFFGFSLGAVIGSYALAYEDRFETAIFVSGGFSNSSEVSEGNAVSFVPRIKVPTLMINGKYDYIFPEKSSQDPMFERLGAPDKDKRKVVFNAGHGLLPRNKTIREVSTWLDKYLGPVRKK